MITEKFVRQVQENLRAEGLECPPVLIELVLNAGMVVVMETLASGGQFEIELSGGKQTITAEAFEIPERMY